MSTESTATPAKQIAAGYAVGGQALELGTVVVDGATDPSAQIRIPLATVNRHGLVAGATGTGKTKTLQVIADNGGAVVQPARDTPYGRLGAATDPTGTAFNLSSLQG